MTVIVRITVAFGVLTLCGGAVVGAAADAAPAPPTCTYSGGATSSDMDLDGDGSSDIAVGVPGARVSGQAGAGAVDVRYGSGKVQRFGESLFAGHSPVAADAFGVSIAYLDVNSDGCVDLAIGAPGADGGRGEVVIALGGSDGISPSEAVTFTGRSVGEHFGSSIVAGTVAANDQLYNDLWISAPDRTVDGVHRAGAVDHYRNSNADYDGDWTPRFVQTLSENTPGIPGGAETGDGFGRTLDADTRGLLFVGEPAEDVGSRVDAGTVTVVDTDSETGQLFGAATYSQNSPGIPGVAETGDHFGTSVSSDSSPASGNSTPQTRVAVGVPGEALGAAAGAGTVDLFALSNGIGGNVLTPSALSQNSAGVPGSDEAYDRFGKRVLFDDGGLCISVPGEDLGRARDTGRVLCHGRQHTSGWQTLQEGSGSIAGTPRSDAAYGSELGRIHYASNDGSGDQEPQYGGEELLVAVPGANVSGVPASGQIRYADRYAFPDSAGPVANERYGVPAFIVSAGPVAPGD